VGGVLKFLQKLKGRECNRKGGGGAPSWEELQMTARPSVQNGGRIHRLGEYKAGGGQQREVDCILDTKKLVLKLVVGRDWKTAGGRHQSRFMLWKERGREYRWLTEGHQSFTV